MTRLLKAALCGLFAATAISALSTARADPVIVALHDVSFDDGGAASGALSLNSYGFTEAGHVITTLGTSLPGETYDVPNAVSPNYLTDPGGNDWIVLFGGAYNIALWLEVAVRPDLQQLVGSDPILGGCETLSYESFCPAAVADTRYINSATASLDVVVPEPAPIAALAIGLLGLSFARTRRAVGHCESQSA